MPPEKQKSPSTSSILLRGRITIDALRLLKPHITLRDSAMATAAPANAQTLFTTLLGGAPVRVLHVRKGRIMLPGERGGTIKEIYAHLDAGKETGAVSGFGSFSYKDYDACATRWKADRSPRRAAPRVFRLPLPSPRGPSARG